MGGKNSVSYPTIRLSMVREAGPKHYLSSVTRPQTLGIKWGVLRRPNGKASLVNPLHGAMPCPGKRAYVTQSSYEPCHAGPLKTMGHMKSSDKTWITGGGNGNPLHYSCCENPKSCSVQLLSCVWPFATPWTVACQASLSFANSQSLLKLMSIELVMPSNHLILCLPLLHLSSVFLSIRVFSNESVLCIGWPKYWSFSFSISPSNEYSGLISLRMDWLDLLTVQGTLKNLLQHHSSVVSILQPLVFFMVQLSHPYITGKTIALTYMDFVGKVMSLLFNMLSSLVIAFLPRSKHLLI